MQLIGMLDSPYVRRVAVALIVAKVPFEHRPISLFRQSTRSPGSIRCSRRRPSSPTMQRC
jgi:glutathione S-transferase